MKRLNIGGVLPASSAALGCMRLSALSVEEAGMKKKDRPKYPSYYSVAHRVAEAIQKETGVESRAVVPGHVQRGGSPCAYDRVFATRLGTYAAELIAKEKYGVSVALKGDKITANPLDEVAGKTKFVPLDHQLIQTARQIGICLGD